MKKPLLLLGLGAILGLAACSNSTGKATFNLPRKDLFIADMDYTAQTDYKKRACDLNEKIADEGMVLLKNQDNCLPFNVNQVKNISVFGKSSTSLQMGGGGSGSGSVSNGITKIDLQDSLKNAGFNINGTLTNFYNDRNASGSGRTNGNTGWTGVSEATVGETPIEMYTPQIKASFSEYNDAAILLLARGGTEGADCKTYDARDRKEDPLSTRHYLELSKNEEDCLDMIEQSFDKVIVLINSGNAFQCDRLEQDDKVSAVIWMGTPGANGTGAIGRFLNGSVNPSGKTVDTWERDFTLNPTFQNFADNSQTNIDPATGKEYAQDTMFNPDGSPVQSAAKAKYSDPDREAHFVVDGGLNGVKPSAYVSYEEGVYLDYRYYETRYHDLENASEGSGDEWYDGEEGVIYPFGYGLSYTEFDQKITKFDKKNKTLNAGDEKVALEVEVTNTGDVAGKDVVQVYFKAPYYEGGIEKPYEILAAFAKTKLLEPGQSQTLKLDFYLQDQASYDFTDANDNGFKGYELDEGNYEISINKNAHEIYDVVECKVAKGGIQYENDRFTGNKVENRFTDRGFFNSLPGELDVGFDQFSREDMEETFPSHPTMEDRTLKEGSRVEEFYTHEFSMADVELNDDGEYMPITVKKTKEDIEALGWSQVPDNAPLTKEQSIQFSEMVGVPMDDPKWTEFMNQMTWKEMRPFVEGGNTHNPAIARMGKPSTTDSDGPSKFGAMWWCGAPIVAATYNIELAHEQGECIALEGHIDNKYGWAGPGVNLHRSPFGGRNFEYYSADPFLTGRIAGRVVGAASDGGIYCYFKHFAVNDQEKNREGVSCFVTEQALRELYLRPFQMCVQEGKTMGIMSSYNRLGLMETAASYPLLTEVLREEWGFVGAIISDMTHRGNSAFNAKCYENINNRVLAGCNNQLDSQSYRDDVNCNWDPEANDGKGAPVFIHEGQKYESYTWYYAMRKAVQECMYICANCGAMSRNFIKDANLTVDGQTNAYIEAKIGERIELEIDGLDKFEVGAEYDGKVIEAVSLDIDPVTPLPEGLSLVDNKIVGTCEQRVNKFIHILVDIELEGEEEPVTVGTSFELFVSPRAEGPKGSASGNVNPALIIGIGGGAVVAIGAVVAVVLVLGRKKKLA